MGTKVELLTRPIGSSKSDSPIHSLGRSLKICFHPEFCWPYFQDPISTQEFQRSSCSGETWALQRHPIESPNFTELGSPGWEPGRCPARWVALFQAPQPPKSRPPQNPAPPPAAPTRGSRGPRASAACGDRCPRRSRRSSSPRRGAATAPGRCAEIARGATCRGVRVAEVRKIEEARGGSEGTVSVTRGGGHWELGVAEDAEVAQDWGNGRDVVGG